MLKVSLSLIILFTLLSCGSPSKLVPTTKIVNKDPLDKVIKEGTILKNTIQSFEVIEVRANSYLVMEKDEENNRLIFEMQKKVNPRIKALPKSKGFIYLNNGIYGEFEYENSHWVKTNTLKYYWDTEKKLPIFTNEFQTLRYPIFSKRFHGPGLYDSVLNLKKLQSTHFISDYSGLRNYKNLKGPILSGIYKKGSDPTDTRNYKFGTYLTKDGVLIFFGEPRPWKKYRGHKIRDIYVQLDSGELAHSLTSFSNYKLPTISTPRIVSIKAENNLYWFGELTNKAKKSGWWTLRNNINGSIQELVLFQNGKKLTQYSFKKGQFNCTHLKNLPNKSEYFSNKEDCSGILIENSLITNKAKTPSDYFNYWGNIVIHNVKIKREKIVKGNVTSLYESSMALGSYLDRALNDKSYDAAFDPQYGNRKTGYYNRRGRLFLIEKDKIIRNQIHFEGYVKNKTRNGPALCTKFPDFQKIPCYWKNDVRIDAQYVQEQERKQQWDRQSKCNTNMKKFAQYYVDLVDKKFVDGDNVLKQLDYSWKRDTTPKSLSCDECYVETIDTAKGQLEYLSWKEKKLYRIEEELPDLYQTIVDNKCSREDVDSYTVKMLDKIKAYRPYLKELNTVSLNYERQAIDLKRKKKRNMRNFQRDINRQMTNHVMTMGSRIFNSKDTISYNKFNNKVQGMVTNQPKSNFKTYRKPVFMNRPTTANTPQKKERKLKVVKNERIYKSKTDFKKACLKNKLNTWEKGQCVTNIPWAGGNCYDPSGKLCYNRVPKKAKGKENAKKAELIAYKNDSFNRNQRTIQSEKLDNPNLKPSKAICWKGSSGWFCYGPLQKLFVSEGTLEIAKRRVGCSNGTLEKELPGKGKLLNKNVLLHNCNSPLKDGFLDVTTMGLF